MEEFLVHVKRGLSQNPKKLSSRYFYDTQGDALYQQIMQLKEYYLPACEMQIIKSRSSEIARRIAAIHPHLQVIELGAGDGSKTRYMMYHFHPFFDQLEYIAMDISANVLEINRKEILEQTPELNYQNVAGNYFETYPKLKRGDAGRLVLFLGANIGNYLKQDAIDFFDFIKSGLQINDYLLVAFDLVKHPRKILKAYDDSKGATKAFNLNLLERINRELGGNFKLDDFDHFPFYNPQNGITTSNIISLKEQEVKLSDGSVFHFDAYEAIHTEVSKKFFRQDIEDIASKSNYLMDETYYDEKKEYAFVLFKHEAQKNIIANPSANVFQSLP
ncbi:MAG: L-histidine N(alpha)-methyltransferase [Balneolales bacterium]|nr:L-histidine N(alpha)-methyltransferase [Balneolales bacterium]